MVGYRKDRELLSGRRPCTQGKEQNQPGKRACEVWKIPSGKRGSADSGAGFEGEASSLGE